MNPLHALVAMSLTAPVTLAGETDAVAIELTGTRLAVSAPDDSLPKVARQRLEQRISVDFNEVPLNEVAAFLARVGAINLVLTPELLAQPPSVTLKADGITLGNALHWIATLTKVRWGWRDEAFYFSDRKMSAPRVAKFHEVADLLRPVPNFPGPDISMPEPGGSGIQVMPPIVEPAAPPSSEELIELVRKFTTR